MLADHSNSSSMARIDSCARPSLTGSQLRSVTSVRTRGWRRGSGRQGVAARRRSPGTVSWSSCLADAIAVSIVIPAMNEEHAIGAVVHELQAAAGWREILVIDDGSIDATGARAAAAGA